MHRRDLSDALGPVPVRQDVGHGKIGAPVRLINVETIFLEAVEIDDAEVGTARRHFDLAAFFKLLGHLRLFGRLSEVQQRRRIATIRRRLAEVIKSRPYKFAGGKRGFIESLELDIGRPGRTRRVEIVRTYLKISAALKLIFDDGKEIFTA